MTQEEANLVVAKIKAEGKYTRWMTWLANGRIKKAWIQAKLEELEDFIVLYEGTTQVEEALELHRLFRTRTLL